MNVRYIVRHIDGDLYAVCREEIIRRHYSKESAESEAASLNGTA